MQIEILMALSCEKQFMDITIHKSKQITSNLSTLHISKGL